MEPSPGPAPAPPPHVVGVLAVAVLAISSAAVLVRAIGPAVHPLALAFWRTLGIAVLLAPAVRRVSRRDAARIALAGVCLAGHFATWFGSLQTLGVLRSTVLVCLGPLWTGFLEWTFLRRRPSAIFFVGLLLALPGIALLTGSDPGPDSLQGDALALLGGMLGAAYLVLGRSVRARVGIGTYASLVCAAAAAALAPAVVLAHVPLVGFAPRTWALIAALAVGPQLLGHNGFNYALRWLPAATVASVTILEPVGATVLAAIFLGERPGPLAILGGVLAVAGVYGATRRPGAAWAGSTRRLPRPPG